MIGDRVEDEHLEQHAVVMFDDLMHDRWPTHRFVASVIESHYSMLILFGAVEYLLMREKKKMTKHFQKN